MAGVQTVQAAAELAAGFERVEDCAETQIILGVEEKYGNKENGRYHHLSPIR